MSAECDVPGCGRRVVGRGFCNTHYRRWERHGDPRAALPIERKTADGAGYWSVHQRLKAERGPASARPCAECGSPAVDWSYDGSDPSERIDPDRGYRYSLDLGRYRARCRSCHRRATTARARPRPRSLSVVDLDRAARLYTAGASARGIARLLGTSRTAVYRALHNAGVPMRTPRNPSSRTRTPSRRTPPIDRDDP